MEFKDIKGLGESRIRKLQAAGITRPLDLLLHFPYKYVDVSLPVDLSTLCDGDELTVCGVIANEPKVQYLRKGLSIIKVILRTDYGEIDVAWFNQKFLARSLPHGKQLYVTGKVKKFRNRISLSAPVILQSIGKRIVPLYRSISGVPQRLLSDAVEMILARSEIHGYIPDEVRKKHRLPTLSAAFAEVHRPSSVESAMSAARALSLEKLGYMLGMFDLVKENNEERRRFVYNTGDEALRERIDSLPFALTDGQNAALREIICSLKSGSSMNRLLQGDVGCGKTIVALLAMYYAHLNGYQSVLMAPTEVLAVQHYKSAIRFLENAGVKSVLLCGSLTKNEREDALFHIRNQDADIIIGTHALLGDDVEFNRLALVITDEQQRFGVNQRSRVENKAVGADTLVMTATPIPRTLALCMYGELEQSNIRSLPRNKAEITTAIVYENKFASMFSYLAERVNFGEQSYVVCPRIENDDETNLVSALEMADILRRKFPSVSIGLLHGKLKDTEKAEVMNRFRDGKIGILVSTTVIEVGIDVPTAANIVICNPERYGLSQLHQLRGRVGRGQTKSYCFLPLNQPADERLQFFCECRDGFALSEYDFNQRGAGDFIGTRQHGDCDDLPVKIDSELILSAKQIAREMLSDAQTAERLRAGLTEGTEQYVQSITLN